jgi:hypothetical protein
MISFIKKIFRKKNEAISEVEYGQIQNFTALTANEKLTFSVGKKYPLPLPKNIEGEALEFMGFLMINLLWKNINADEMKLLKGLCQAISIYQDIKTQIVIVTFVFSGKPIILAVTGEQENVHEWTKQNFNELSAYFFLTESSTKKILQIRNIGLPIDFIKTLQSILVNYKQPEVELVAQVTGNINPQDLFDETAFSWLYSQEEDRFIQQ